MFMINLLSCNNQITDEINNKILYGNWTQIKNRYKGPPEHLSEIGYGELEIHFVSDIKWIQYFNKQDSIECSTWFCLVRNDSLFRSPDNWNYNYVGIISKSNDTLVIDEDHLTIWFVPYHSNTLPDNWSKKIVKN